MKTFHSVFNILYGMYNPQGTHILKQDVLSRHIKVPGGQHMSGTIMLKGCDTALTIAGWGGCY